MPLSFFAQGLVIGFSIAAPVGPIGVLCIRRSLADGRLVGFATGLGAATADAGYGCIAGFGLTAVSDFLVGQRFWLGVLGGLFLCYLGIATFIARPAEDREIARSNGPLLAYFSALALTITNPATILSFAAVFAGLGLVAQRADYAAATTLVAGVFLGSAIWWLILSGSVGFVRSGTDRSWMRTVNRISGAIIFGFGAYSLLSQLRP
jgi:threonine/homoserine/homoserine lactone efflux protein